MSTIYPTHTCFDDCMEYFDAITKQNKLELLESLVVVHAIITAPSGEKYVHAWLEQEDLIVQAGILDGKKTYFTIPRDQFYGATVVVEKTEYSWNQVFLENLRTRTFGPWFPQYKALCSKSERTWEADYKLVADK